MEIACPSSHWHMATLARNLEWKKRTNHFLQTCKPDPIYWVLVPEYCFNLKGGKHIVIDGSLLDNFYLAYGYWEAKDIRDDLPTEVSRKFKAGYPQTNILFQTPKQAILWQDNQRFWIPIPEGGQAFDKMKREQKN